METNYELALNNVVKKTAVIDTDEIRAEGGTFALGGISEAELNVTYNYGKIFNFKL